jgi:hypothetical protein
MAHVDQQVKDYTAYVYPRFVRIGRTMPQLAIHFTNAEHTPVLADAAGWRAVVDRLLVELGEAGQELVDSPAPQPLIQTIHQRVLIVGRSCCELAGDLKAAVAAHDVTALNGATDGMAQIEGQAKNITREMYQLGAGQQAGRALGRGAGQPQGLDLNR